MSVKPVGPPKDIKTDVIHHPVKASVLIFTFYNQSSICLLVPKSVANFRIFDIKSDLPEFRNSLNAKFSSLALWQYATDVTPT